MNEMFRDCSSLSSLPDISKWNTNNVTNISNMFYYCKRLPDISKWKTINVTNMSFIFYNCLMLSSLPEISKWNTNNVTLWVICFIVVHHYHLYLIFQNEILIMLLI